MQDLFFFTPLQMLSKGVVQAGSSLKRLSSGISIVVQRCFFFFWSLWHVRLYQPCPPICPRARSLGHIGDPI